MSSVVKSFRFTKGTYKTDYSERPVVHTKADIESISLAEQKELRDVERESKIVELKRDLENAVKSGEEKAQQAQEEGFKAGRDKGFSEGLVQGQTDIKPAIEQIQQLMLEIENGVQQVWDESRQAMTSLVLEISQKVIGEITDQYEGLVVDLTRSVIKRVRDQAKVAIYVSPEDVEALKAARTELTALAEGIKSIDVVERPSIPKGSVIIETNAGQFDARIDEQLEVIKASFMPGWAVPQEDDEDEDEDESEIIDADLIDSAEHPEPSVSIDKFQSESEHE